MCTFTHRIVGIPHSLFTQHTRTARIEQQRISELAQALATISMEKLKVSRQYSCNHTWLVNVNGINVLGYLHNCGVLREREGGGAMGIGRGGAWG